MTHNPSLGEQLNRARLANGKQPVVCDSTRADCDCGLCASAARIDTELFGDRFVLYSKRVAVYAAQKRR